jgi:hypothetical protein
MSEVKREIEDKEIMKTKTVISMASVLTLFGLAGCSVFHYVALRPVGPNPTAPIEAQQQGILEVYTADTKPVGGQFPREPLHTDYTISCDTWFCERVHNVRSQDDARPKLVSLEPGNYTVEAQASNTNSGTFATMVPVVIKAGRTTKIYLDGEWQPGGPSMGAQLVRLPTGAPVGWYAY